MNALWPPPILRNVPTPRILSSLQTAIIAFGLLSILIICLTVTLIIDSDRKNAISGVQQNNSNIARLIEEHVSHTIGQVDQSLQVMTLEINRQGPTFNVVDFSQDHLLKGSLYNGFELFAPDGTVIASSGKRFSPQARSQSILVQKNPGPQPFLSQAHKLPDSNDFGFLVSRRVENNDGSLKLIVAASLNSSFFSRFINDVDIGKRGNIVIVGLRDGIVRVHNLMEPGLDVGNAPLFDHLPIRPNGYYQARTVDGTERIVSYRTVRDYPLVVVVSTPVDEPLANLVERESSYWRAGMAISVLVLIFTAGLFFALRHQEKTETSLIVSEEKFRQMFEQQKVVMLLIQPETLSIMDANSAAARFYGYSKNKLRSMKLCDLCLSVEEEIFTLLAKARHVHGKSVSFQQKLHSGAIRDTKMNVTYVSLKDRAFYFAIVSDVTEQLQTQNRLEFLTYHDPLTGLFNRRFFEERLSHFDDSGAKLGIIICDLDGLKIVNDTLGHERGDALLIQMADILRSSIRSSDFAARIGGDEFALLVCGLVSKDVVKEVADNIRSRIREQDPRKVSVPVNASIGWVYGNGKTCARELYKQADNSMYREKLNKGKDTHGALVSTIAGMLDARDYRTEGHAERMADLVCRFAEQVGFMKRKTSELRLFARFHDLGKVGIPDRILLKPGKLTPEEMEEMKRHSEIGHRIAIASPHLSPIAELILHHQERWDGTGYPQGLSGSRIPLECRMLAIVDAYDAMTNDRPYRKAMSHDDAIAELKRYSGTQFDPELVEGFLELMK